MNIICGYWTDDWADNWVTVYWEEATRMYMMEYRCYDSGVAGRNAFDKKLFDAIIRKYKMKKQW